VDPISTGTKQVMCKAHHTTPCGARFINQHRRTVTSHTRLQGCHSCNSTFKPLPITLG